MEDKEFQEVFGKVDELGSTIINKLNALDFKDSGDAEYCMAFTVSTILASSCKQNLMTKKEAKRKFDAFLMAMKAIMEKLCDDFFPSDESVQIGEC